MKVFSWLWDSSNGYPLSNGHSLMSHGTKISETKYKIKSKGEFWLHDDLFVVTNYIEKMKVLTGI